MKAMENWKISIFCTFLKPLFSGLESIHIYPEYQNTILSGLFCPKNADDKKFDFLTKTMETFGKFRFFCRFF